MSNKIGKKIFIIAALCIIIVSLILIYTFTSRDTNTDNENINTPQPAQQNPAQGEENSYLNNIQIKDLSIQKCQDKMGDEIEQGLNFVITYKLPEINNAIKDHKIGFQIVYPKEYATLFGTNMTGISYIYPNVNISDIMDTSFSIYAPNVTTEEIDELLQKKGEFKICIFLDESKKREIIVQNAMIEQ